MSITQNPMAKENIDLLPFPVIDPHIHMSSRTTDDYQVMAARGVRAVIEPAFWLGQPRTSPDSYRDALATLVGWECFRARQFGIHHFCAIGLNAREANDDRLAQPVLEMLPLFLQKETVVAVGEIGFDEQTAAEERAVVAQLALAVDYGLPVMVHTPHRDKRRGTLRLMEMIADHGLPPEQVVIDHNNEMTVKDVLDRGYWCAFTLYPQTKMGSERMVEIARAYPCETMFINSSADWGLSDPLAVPKTASLMLDRGIPLANVRQLCAENALKAYDLPADLLTTPLASSLLQGGQFSGNTILRGQTAETLQSEPDTATDARLIV